MEWEDRIGRRIRLRDLHILLAVAQAGSMARAAEHLAISQPVVSKVIADLEHVLGVRVLDRDRHGAEPTVYGRALLSRGLAAFDELRQGVKDIDFLRDPTAGELRVGGPDQMVGGLIPAIIGELSRQYPRLVFHVTVLPAGLQRYRALREREVELVFSRIPQSFAENDLDVELLFDEPQFVAAGAQNRWLRRRQIELSELIDEPWVLPQPDSLPGALVTELFRAAGLDVPKATVICASLQMNDTLLATGKYLAIYPGSILRFGNKQPAIKILPVRLPVQSRQVGILSLKSRLISPVARLFVECARTLTKSLDLAALPQNRRRSTTRG